MSTFEPDDDPRVVTVALLLLSLAVLGAAACRVCSA
jgi:hypothetical protein